MQSIADTPLADLVLAAREARWAAKIRLVQSMPSKLAGFQDSVSGGAPEASLAVLTLRMPSCLRSDLRMASWALCFHADFLETLHVRGIPIAHKEFNISADGPECYYIVRCAASLLKDVAVEWETSHSCGELIDLDVMDSECRVISRNELGYQSRKCLLCEQEAAICSSTQSHPLISLTQRIEEILANETAKHDICNTIGRLAVKALIFEVSTFPKPGLVCPESKGAHDDMDYALFLSSIFALAPFFKKFVKIGYCIQASGEKILKDIRSQGLVAEHAMLEATGGVNTHKGLIFSLGLLCASAGRITARGQKIKPEALCAEASSIVEGICSRELETLVPEKKSNFTPISYSSCDLLRTITAGERLFIEFGIRGIRGEAEDGFPSVIRHSLPCLRAKLESGFSLNDALVSSLLSLFSVVEDSNVFARSGMEGLVFLRQEADRCQAKGSMSTSEGRTCIKALDSALKERNISPGGCADLLALTLFVHDSEFC